jgi:hypothetical protein
VRRRSIVAPTIIASVVGGFAGVGAVFAGLWFDVPGFSPRTGYAGAHFLDSVLYAMGDDTAAMTVVSIVFFAYSAALFGIVNAVLLLRRARRPDLPTT